ncbi:hypothetical protein [Streptomyces sp. SID14515]|uniref:hypothetical protein n=1 Tax=Streptomyces sp. SID14515 TaxID=2706074 RepID=UPI0013CA98AA|nr:hypothetical protein [Streptomyces sp. SID14515]NEB35799.1 hypothetical protein [Streptomyces sp. SID14515]
MWSTEEFGASHEGQPGVVLADGVEPGPVFFDTGSGSHVHQSTSWWVYDGSLRSPVAAQLRGACSCGWRGESLYPIDWDDVDRREPYAYDTTGPQDDWARHIAEVEAGTVPLPDDVAELLGQVQARLDTLAEVAPLAALRAVAALERATHRAGRMAANLAAADDATGEQVGPALGIAPDKARSLLTHYGLR